MKNGTDDVIHETSYSDLPNSAFYRTSTIQFVPTNIYTPVSIHVPIHPEISVIPHPIPFIHLTFFIIKIVINTFVYILYYIELITLYKLTYTFHNDIIGQRLEILNNSMMVSLFATLVGVMMDCILSCSLLIHEGISNIIVHIVQDDTS